MGNREKGDNIKKFSYSLITVSSVQSLLETLKAANIFKKLEGVALLIKAAVNLYQCLIISYCHVSLIFTTLSSFSISLDKDCEDCQIESYWLF